MVKLLMPALRRKKDGEGDGAKERDDGGDGENHRVVGRPAGREEVPQPTRKEATDEQPQAQNRHIDERLRRRADVLRRHHVGVDEGDDEEENIAETVQG
jgi:hypothetical protein